MKHRLLSKSTGAALVIALAFLVLISGLVLALLTSVRLDRSNATAFASSQDNQRLVDNTVNVVISQIREATTQTNQSWASQPGMIRAYNAAGNLANAYRLYSYEAMTSSAAVNLAGESATLSTAWAGQSNYNARHADLNAPVYALRPDPSDNTQSIWQPVFPIADPAAIGQVEGFSVTPFNGSVPGNGNDRRLPMPVQWLYQLQDGSLIAPDSTSSTATKAVFTGVKVPSKSNPIVGRIAFWTDDDTCKVNINTASEGSFWDIPSSVARTEAYMAFDAPVKGEFQATGGHPATTSLSPILGGAAPATGLFPRPASALAPFYISATDYTNYFAPYYRLSPRISDNAPGGTTSKAGSTQTTGDKIAIGRPVVYDTDRLYATVDELLFDPSRTINAPLSAKTISQRNFFLTATSRAPETTLFGTPRISLWPMQNLRDTPSTLKQDPRDQLLSFCSTLGTNRYYFERYRVGVRQGGAIVTGSANSITDDYSLVQRNQDLHGYLKKMMQQDVPGFGASFADKWSANGIDRMATMSFDFLRSNVNLFRVPGPGNRSGVSNWGYEIPVPLGNAQGGYIMPLKINGNMGFGRNTAITEVSIVFMAASANSAKETTSWQSFMLFNIYRPGVEASGAPPGLRLRVTSDASIGINGEIRSMKRGGGPADARNFAFPGPHVLLNKNTMTDSDPRKVLSPSTNLDDDFPFFSAVKPVPPGATTFDFAGGQVKVELLEPYGTTPAVVQTITLQFPPVAGLPLPQAVDADGQFVSAATGANSAQTFEDRMKVAGIPEKTVRPGDIARSLRFSSATDAPHKGDLRLLLLKGDINSPADKWFEPHSQYSTIPVAYTFPADSLTNGAARLNRYAHSLRNDMEQYVNNQPYIWADAKSGTTLNGGVNRSYLCAGYDNSLATSLRVKAGGLIAATVSPAPVGGAIQFGTAIGPANYMPSPVIPQGLTAALNSSGTPGDFTNSFGMVADGATVAIPNFGSLKSVTSGFYSEQNAAADSGEGQEPNRQVPSPIIFGTLPSPASDGEPAPWQTLLFNPVPFCGTGHLGFGIGTGGPGPGTRAPVSTLPDHLFLDLWWMPAVDPYAVSEPLSTAGKVNLNYQIAPFTHVKRETAVIAALKSVRMAGFQDTDSTRYKVFANDNDLVSPIYYNPGQPTRYHLNLSNTVGSLKGFQDRFDTGDIFRSASEICTVPLIPDGYLTTNIANSFWRTRRLTGDNLRESPYNALYSRITTKSNTFTVHYRVQPLKQANRGGGWTEWNEGNGDIRGEFRGSTTIERYLNPNEANIPDYAAGTTLPAPIDRFYRFRVLSSSQFAP